MKHKNTRSTFLATPIGIMVVIGSVALLLLIVAIVYFSLPGKGPPPPEGVPFGVPTTRLRIVAYDLAQKHPLEDPAFIEIPGLNPDYVLLQGVNEGNIVEIVEAFGMLKSFHPQLYQRSARIAGSSAMWGNLTLSRQPMYAGAPLGGRRGGFGNIAVSIVDNNEFLVANLHLSPGDDADHEADEMGQEWTARGSPPIVAVVRPSDPEPPEALAYWIKVPKVTGECFYVSKEWKIIGGGRLHKNGTGPPPIWIDVIKAGLPAAGAENNDGDDTIPPEDPSNAQ